MTHIPQRMTTFEQLLALWGLTRRLRCLLLHQDYYEVQQGIWTDQTVCTRCQTRW